MRLALLTEDNVVETVVEANEDFQPPVGFTAVAVDDAVGAGDVYDGKTFTRPPPPVDTATLGQLVDIALQLGSVKVDDITALLPTIAKGEVTQDPDGSIVVMDSEIADVVADAVLKGAEPPKDIPPTPDAEAAAAAADVAVAETPIDIKP
jgi:hypothetical protein